MAKQRRPSLISKIKTIFSARKKPQKKKSSKRKKTSGSKKNVYKKPRRKKIAPKPPRRHRSPRPKKRPIPNSIRRARGTPAKRLTSNRAAKLERGTYAHSQLTVTRKRYSQNLAEVISFKRRSINYAKPVRRGKINKFFREQVRGVDAKNFYREYGKSGLPQKFIQKIKYRVRIPGHKGWVDKWASRSRFRAKSEKEFLALLKDKYTGFSNPAELFSKYAVQNNWDAYEITGVEFEVII